MTAKTKAIVLTALHRYRGDDYERASRAFSRYTPTEMLQQHGESGRTRQEWLNEYRTHARDVQVAIREVEAL